MSGQITHGSHCIVFMIADNGVVVSFLDIVEQDLAQNFSRFRYYINLYGKRDKLQHPNIYV